MTCSILRRTVRVFVMVIFLSVSGLMAGSLRVADIGDFELENGNVITDCQVGYRTFGKLNFWKSNVVIFPSWFGGTSAGTANLVGGPDNLIDSTKYYVICLDALGDGISSSPENSVTQPGEKFPRFTIRDMVKSQYQLLTEVLGLKKAYAVIGGSMGGMQAFEWAASYPDFMKKVIPYVGSTRLTSNDLLFIEAELSAIRNGKACGMPEAGIREIVARIQSMVVQTPAYRVRNTTPEAFPDYLAGVDDGFERFFRTNDWKAQLYAMQSHDISKPYGGGMQKAADAVRADLLVIVSQQDHIVNPTPAMEFARLTNAELVVFDNDCGHLAPGCEMARFIEIVHQFLDD
ncbi:MAG: alpha/beta fold hydrolase [Candidatus Marinimicrobia bacterium]|nr:alpha/beta fold hydrolase [Candidatus Neomarinimicrobiota bacterium]MCF7840972.1 alpha/beta fold hydrolase [Candidatus Neomarinimicrobiota bacterium]MCF7902699.1 alpha/beta fold hydrolase [Candidatus Neomarinimicrobiota bacterium]